jgi:hypothetical protein
VKAIHRLRDAENRDAKNKEKNAEKERMKVVRAEEREKLRLQQQEERAEKAKQKEIELAMRWTKRERLTFFKNLVSFGVAKDITGKRCWIQLRELCKLPKKSDYAFEAMFSGTYRMIWEKAEEYEKPMVRAGPNKGKEKMQFVAETDLLPLEEDSTAVPAEDEIFAPDKAYRFLQKFKVMTDVRDIIMTCPNVSLPSSALVFFFFLFSLVSSVCRMGC